MSQLFTSDGQSIAVSALVLPMKIRVDFQVESTPIAPLLQMELIFTVIFTVKPPFIYLYIHIIFREGNGTPLQYSCLKNPMDRGAWKAAVHGVAEGRTRLSGFTFTFLHWRRKWQPSPVFLPGESQGWGSLVGCHLWGRRVGYN